MNKQNLEQDLNSLYSSKTVTPQAITDVLKKKWILETCSALKLSFIDRKTAHTGKTDWAKFEQPTRNHQLSVQHP